MNVEVIDMPALDYKKQYKDLYLPPEKPMLIDVPQMNFLMADGEGNPNGNQAFEDAVGALYSMSYTLKMLPKKGIVPEGYIDYTVPPLEGLWWLAEDGTFSFTQRSSWRWTVMIRQPDFVTAQLVNGQLPGLHKKKPNPALEKLRLASFTEGLCVQMMHIGPYASEPATVAAMEGFMRVNGLATRLGHGGKHHEVYISDPGRSKPENMKTVLRIPVLEGK
jgi:hypothetical protein